MMPKRAAPSLGPVEVAVFLLLALVVGVQTFYLLTYVQNQGVVVSQLQCQTEVNDRFRIALTERVDASARDRQAQRDFLASARDGLVGGEIDTYLRALDDADRARTTPIPAGRC